MMNKNSFKALSLAIALGLLGVSCSSSDDTDTDSYITKKEVVYPTFDAPQWSGSSSTQAQYDGTMTAYVSLPDSLASSEDTNDQMAVFVGNSCRETVTRTMVADNVYVWTVLIHGNAGEALTFKYYSAKTKHMYLTPTTVTFAEDTQYGNIDSPKALGLNYVTSK